MKKLVALLFFALMLVLPAMSSAGTATSAWDMTIGGFVKTEIGWADQGVGADMLFAERRSRAKQNPLDEYGNFFMAEGESRVSFLSRGPDAFGAKMSAVLEIGVLGNASGGSSPNGTAVMRHAYIRADWANDSLIFGLYWNPFQFQGANGVYTDGQNMLTPPKAVRQPQVQWEHRLDKNGTRFSLTAMYPTSWGKNGPGATVGQVNGSTGGAQNTVDSNTQSMIPTFAGVLEWKSPACGKIGNNMLDIFLSGMWGVDKKNWWDASGRTQDQNLQYWLVNLSTYIPLIPMKNMDRTGALGFSGGAFVGAMDNALWIASSGSYNQRYGSLNAATNTATDAVGPNYTAPTVWAVWAGLEYFMTNSVSLILGADSQQQTHVSSAYQINNPNQKLGWQSIGLALKYDVNPALRLAADVNHVYNKYSGAGNATQGSTGYADYGNANTFRMVGYYFF